MTQGADERSGPRPTDPEQEARRDEVERLLRDVGAYQLEGYRTLTREDISIKEDTGHGRAVVTKYDVETEKRVFQFVEQHFPKDSFLGEENGNVRKDPDRYWILDPIDGTTNFTQGLPFWGPSLAFFDEEGAKEGWEIGSRQCPRHPPTDVDTGGPERLRSNPGEAGRPA